MRKKITIILAMVLLIFASYYFTADFEKFVKSALMVLVLLEV